MAAMRSPIDEWLVTNGRGGYAFGTVEGPPARSYHGLLVVARRPPVERTVIVAGSPERVAGRELRWGDARMDGRRVVVRATVVGGVVERTTWMPHGVDATYVRYALVEAAADGAAPAGVAVPVGVAARAGVAAPAAGATAARLEVAPLVTERDHHAVRRHTDRDAPPAALRILVDGQEVRPRVAGVRTMPLPEEAARGQADETDALVLEPIVLTLRPDTAVTVIYTTETTPVDDGTTALEAARARDAMLLRWAGATEADPLTRRLVLAADAFLVERAIPGVGPGRTVIAGYPWFNDWGRDTMIALPGLCLATGRHDEARTILRSFAGFVRDGLIPNDFPDDPDVEPAYHTIDASLWFIQAIDATVQVAGDAALLAELLPSVRAILDAHLEGTRFGIGMDAEDGLLRGGAPGLQLTWMDARVDDWVVTPRRGKPVEIQALWIAALDLGARWTGDARYAAAAARAAGSFRARFWRPELGYLADVVDGPDGDDPALRPNQLLALTLPLERPLVDAAMAHAILDAVGASLAVPCGLRSLAPRDAAYRATYQGDRWTRDAAYHQGTAWTWLIGPYADAVARWGGGPAASRAILEPFAAHLDVAGIGSVAEILEPEAPFTPRGCPFQAWGVAEVLRTWRRYGPPAARLSPEGA